MTTEQMTPEEEVRLRLAAGISPSTPTEYMLRHIPLWVKMSILRRNSGVGGGGGTPPPKKVTTYDFTTNTYRKNGSKVSLSDISEFIRLSSATKWQDGQLVEVANNIPRISGEGLLIEPQRTNISCPSEGARGRGYGTTPPVVTNEIQDFGGRDVIVPRIIYTADTTTGYGGRSYLGIEATTVVGENYIGSVYAKGVAVNLHMYYAGSGARGGLTLSFSSPDKFQRVYSRATIEMYSGLQRLTLMKRIPMQTGDVSVTGAQLEEVGSSDGFASSYIKTTSSPATRSPDILNILLLPTQTLSGDWDTGVTYEDADNIATFTGHGYIRNITVETL